MAEAFSPERKAVFWGILILLIVVVPFALAEIAVRAVSLCASQMIPICSSVPSDPFSTRRSSTESSTTRRRTGISIGNARSSFPPSRSFAAVVLL